MRNRKFCGQEYKPGAKGRRRGGDLPVKNDHTAMKHVLIISGEPRILAEIKMELMSHFDISIAATSDSALNALEAYDVSATVICISGNSDEAFSIFNSIFEFVKSHNIPIIFLAEKGNDADETTAFAMGAVDYSARRHGTANALINRIRLRINASEHERHITTGNSEAEASQIAPESVLIGKTILVADDVDLNREIISAMLSDIEGLKLDLACDGHEAVEKFEEAPDLYSLILMDIHMPVMDGLAATKIIRGLDFENARNVPVIALTAAADEADIELYLESGMDDFIEKPMSYDRLLSIAAEHCL